MILNLLIEGQVVVFALIVIAIILSLSFHEFGHAYAAKLYGDNTAQSLGRLTVNPISHIDPVGLLMVILVGIGYAKPVPFDPRNFKSVWGIAGTAVAGPVANLIIAFVAVNIFVYGSRAGWSMFEIPHMDTFFSILVQINLILMIFNMIPLGILDGHHILPYFLPRKLAHTYRTLNQQYGMYLLLGLLLLSVVGLPVLGFIHTAASWFLKLLIIV